MSDVDYTRVLFGENARHVSAWLYVQRQGEEYVGFAGGSRATTRGAHPLRYGSDRAHQFIIGELVIRPHRIVATDALRGEGLASLITSGHDIDAMLNDGEILYDAGLTR